MHGNQAIAGREFKKAEPKASHTDSKRLFVLKATILERLGAFGPIYTGPDEFLHGRILHLDRLFTWDRANSVKFCIILQEIRLIITC